MNRQDQTTLVYRENRARLLEAVVAAPRDVLSAALQGALRHHTPREGHKDLGPLCPACSTLEGGLSPWPCTEVAGIMNVLGMEKP